MKTELEIGQRWIVKEQNCNGIVNPDCFFIIDIINKVKNYKNQNRWIALKLVPKKEKFDIQSGAACLVVFDDWGVEQQWDFIYNVRNCWYKLIKLKGKGKLKNG